MKFFLVLFLIGQILMASRVEHIEVNGLKVPFIVEEDKRLPIVTMQIVFTDSGNIANTKIAGLSKFSAKILNEGSKKLPSSKFAEALESRAIHISATTGRETFVIELSCLKDEFKTALEYLKELLQAPNYSKEALLKVKTLTLGSLSAKENDFDYVASNELKKVLFADTVLAKPANGTKQSIEKITLKDVKEFINKHLVLSRVIVVVGGDIQNLKPMTKVLDVLPKGEAQKVKHFEVRKTPKEVIIRKDTKQAYVYFGSPYNLHVGDANYYKARVATYILGSGGFGSRLMEEIRVKKGLAYSAYARVSVTKSANYMSGYLQTKLDSLDEAKKSVKDVVDRFVKDGVSEDELAQAKKFLLGSEPLRVESMNQRLNRAFMEYYKGFKLGHTKEELKQIEALNLKELNSFIKLHSEIKNLSFAIVTK